MNAKLLEVVRRAQDHGWRVDYVDEELVLLVKSFYRGRPPRIMFVTHEGRVHGQRRSS